MGTLATKQQTNRIRFIDKHSPENKRAIVNDYIFLGLPETHSSMSIQPATGCQSL